MPELPEVETTVRGLRHHIEGERIERVRMNRPDMRFPFPPALAERLTGTRITHLSRRAKYGLLHTGRGDVLVFHLGMSGRWRIDPQAEDRHDHLVLDTSGHRLALNDPRRFGWVDLVEETALPQWRAFALLGPEPLGPGFDGAYLKAALAGRRSSIKQALLDQRVVAGLGNIYVCEALHRARIGPRRRAGRTGAASLSRLAEAIRAVLGEAIADGGSTLRDFRGPEGQLGYFATRFDVYGREGAPCRSCGEGVIRRAVMQGRSTWWCPTCQR
jgi:formamidopyrimidine-DNA glycosylase